MGKRIFHDGVTWFIFALYLKVILSNLPSVIFTSVLLGQEESNKSILNNNTYNNPGIWIDNINSQCTAQALITQKNCEKSYR